MKFLVFWFKSDFGFADNPVQFGFIVIYSVFECDGIRQNTNRNLDAHP